MCKVEQEGMRYRVIIYNLQGARKELFRLKHQIFNHTDEKERENKNSKKLHLGRSGFQTMAFNDEKK